MLGRFSIDGLHGMHLSGLKSWLICGALIISYLTFDPFAKLNVEEVEVTPGFLGLSVEPAVHEHNAADSISDMVHSLRRCQVSLWYFGPFQSTDVEYVQVVQAEPHRECSQVSCGSSE